MTRHALLRFSLGAVFALLVTACASVRHMPPAEETSGETVQTAVPYTPEREAAEVAQMRAAPAPDAAQIVIGNGNDANRWASEGFVRIGSGHYEGDEAFVREETERQSRAVGADRVLLQAPAAEGAAAWTADYYVRFRLAFGASFRDLRAAERESLGGKGGVQIGAVVNGTPASRANLMSGDFVIALNGRAIAGKAAFQDALRANVGRNVMLTVVRNGETRKRIVRLGGGAPAANAQ